MVRPKSLAKRAEVAASDTPPEEGPAAAEAPFEASNTQPSYVIKCSRKTTMKSYDDASFDDCYGQEVDEHCEEIDRTAVEGDGVWIFDQGNERQHGSREHSTAGLHRTPGKLRTFKSLLEANQYAALVWKDLQATHPFVEEATADEVKKAGSAQAAKRSSSGRKRKAVADECAERGTKEGGCASWKQEQLYVVDPWGVDVRNLASSVLTVEVVKAAKSAVGPHLGPNRAEACESPAAVA